MDATVGNLDEQDDRNLAARGSASVLALRPEPYPDGNERLSSDIDAVVYGAQR